MQVIERTADQAEPAESAWSIIAVERAGHTAGVFQAQVTFRSAPPLTAGIKLYKGDGNEKDEAGSRGHMPALAVGGLRSLPL